MKPIAGYTPSEAGLQAKMSRLLSPELRTAVTAAYSQAHGWHPNPREEINFTKKLVADAEVGFFTAREVANLIEAAPFSSAVEPAYASVDDGLKDVPKVSHSVAK